MNRSANSFLKFIPLVRRLGGYSREDLTGDLIAGIVVAIMLVPQAMAYAMLAGLPPQVGLYASILPLVIYSLFGSSDSLAVGPVAMISLLVLSGVGQLAEPGSERFIALCLTLALMAGVLQIAMAVFRLGFLVNFISHPVLGGFTSAAAIVIGFSQANHLFGVHVPGSEYPWQMIVGTFSKLVETQPVTLGIGVAGILILVFFQYAVTPLLGRFGFSKDAASTISKTGPLVAVIALAIVVGWSGLNTTASLAVVGAIPAGLPVFTVPATDWSAIRSLLPLALVITLVGYLESISVAKALATRKRKAVSPDQELFALGLADVAAAFSAGYPVTGGFSRTLVNDSAGARTPVGSLITAGLVALSVAFFTPAFFYIPKAVLAAIIVVAVARLVDLRTPVRLWRFSRPDAIAFAVTFFAVIAMGIETGIAVGVVTTILVLVWSMSRPHIAEVGRLGNSEHFRNRLRHDVQLVDGILAVRIDESLNFANAPFLETWFQHQLAKRPEIHEVLLIASGINDIDATGIEVLEKVRRELKEAKVGFSLSDVKGPVTDRLFKAGIDPDFMKSRIFLSTHQAIQALSKQPKPTEPIVQHEVAHV